MRANSWLTVIGLLLMVSLPAQAHTGIGTVHGLADGLLHPLIGIDHVAVMLAIGLWAAMRGGRALWLLPMTFLMAMGAGAGLQIIGYALTNAETWVALSVLATGLLGNMQSAGGFAEASLPGDFQKIFKVTDIHEPSLL